MGIFSDKITGWYNVTANDGKYDLKSFAESVKLLIEVNNSELNTYTSYLIAVFSILIPIYFTLWSFKAPILAYLILIELNAIILIIILRNINNIKEGNDKMIEIYNSIQSELGGGFLVRIDGKKEDVIRQVREWNKKYNFEEITPKFKFKSP